MKKCFQTQQAKKYQARRSRRQARATQRRKKPGGRHARVTPVQPSARGAISRFKTIKTPIVFSFVDNPHETARFFSDLRAKYRKATKRQGVAIDLQEVRKMTPEVIVVLLSRLKDPQFTRRRATSGNVPRDALAKRMLEESGFYDYVSSPNRPRADTHGLILREDNDTVDAHQSAQLISKVAQRLPMTISQRDGLEVVAVECMTNTIEHAAGRESKRERWWFSAYNNPDAKRAQFAFVDNGVGIFESLGKHPPHWFRRIVGITNSGDRIKILKALIAGDRRSRTRRSYRGRGLPTIANRNRLRHIRRLVIVSNNIFADVEQSRYDILDYEFRGTILCWEHAVG